MSVPHRPCSKFQHFGARASVLLVFFILGGSHFIASRDWQWESIGPSCAALLIVILSRSAFSGLLVGALCGAVLLADGLSAEVVSIFWTKQFAPIFSSSWKLSAILFTLLLGGFVALLEAGGGLQALIRRLLRSSESSPENGAAKRMQYTVFGFGLFVFFDGLANTMLIGRLLRGAADRCGVSREKLAYLADTTGSAVACLAFVSTWIAFQLSMIREGFLAVGQESSAYSLFFRSLPTNFYCLFSLILAGLSIHRNFNPGAMQHAEARARLRENVSKQDQVEATTSSHWSLAVVPILVLTLSIPIVAYYIGAEDYWPVTLEKFATAYGVAEEFVPQILVASSLLASVVAGLIWWRSQQAEKRKLGAGVSIFLRGVQDLLAPVAILLVAWMLGAAISELGAADLISELLRGRLDPHWLPLFIFIVGALISFSTGTSWGTMGVMMPLAIPVIFAVAGEGQEEALSIAAIGAVFSGAVFGDHCSPFSDTTIVSSIASGVEPVDHVKTQLPFAGIAALVAAFFGFLPLGFGFSPWLCLILGTIVLYGIVLLGNPINSIRLPASKIER